MKLQEQVSQSDSRPITTEQVSVSEDSTEKTKASSDSYSSFDTASVLQTLASATEAKKQRAADTGQYVSYPASRLDR